MDVSLTRTPRLESAFHQASPLSPPKYPVLPCIPCLHLLITCMTTVNEVRALRLAEIMQDFRNLQYYISQIHAVPTQEEYNGLGYVLLRQCNAEGQAVLNAPFSASQSVPAGNPEREKQHLQ